MFIFHLFHSKCFAKNLLFAKFPALCFARRTKLTAPSRDPNLTLQKRFVSGAAPRCSTLPSSGWESAEDEGEWRDARQQERGGWRGARWRSRSMKRASLKAGKGSSSPWLLCAAKQKLLGKQKGVERSISESLCSGWSITKTSAPEEYLSLSGGFVCWTRRTWSPDLVLVISAGGHHTPPSP